MLHKYKKNPSIIKISKGMDKVKIKRVKRNKKQVSTPEKILAGLGLVSGLAGGAQGFVKPQKTVIVGNSNNTRGNAIQKTVNSIFNIPKAHAEGLINIAQLDLRGLQTVSDVNNSKTGEVLALEDITIIDSAADSTTYHSGDKIKLSIIQAADGHIYDIKGTDITDQFDADTITALKAAFAAPASSFSDDDWFNLAKTANLTLYGSLSADAQAYLNNASNAQKISQGFYAQNYQTFAPGSVLAWAFGMGTSTELNESAKGLGFVNYDSSQGLFTKQLAPPPAPAQLSTVAAGDLQGLNVYTISANIYASYIGGVIGKLVYVNNAGSESYPLLTAYYDQTLSQKVLDIANPEQVAQSIFDQRPKPLAQQPLTLLSPKIHSGTVGQNFEPIIFTAQGGEGPYTWSARGNIPPGLDFSEDGTLTGLPQAAGDFSFFATAKDSQRLSAILAVSVHIDPAPAQPAAPPAITGVQGYDGVTKIYTNVTAAAGKYLIIYGNFSDNNDNRAFVDGQPANVTGQTQNQINILLDSNLSPGQHTVTVENPGGDSNQSTFTILGAVEPLVISSEISGQTFNLGDSFSLSLTASGGSGNFTWSAQNLPNDLSLNGALISGNLTQPGDQNFTVSLSDGSQSVSKNFSVYVKQNLPGNTDRSPQTIISQGNTLPFGSLTANEKTALTLYLTDNPSALTDQNFQSFAPGSVLAWALGMGTGLELSGSAKSLGFVRFDPNQNLFVKESLPPQLQPLVIGPQTSVATVQAGDQYSLALRATGGSGSYAWTAQGLPEGLSLNGNLISGSPLEPSDNQPHDYAIIITVNDGQTSVSQNFTLRVNPKTVPLPAQSNTPFISGMQGYNAATKQYSDSSHVSGGQYLILWGNFSGNSDNIVIIDGQKADNTAQLPNQINILLGANLTAGQHNVSVTNLNGSSGNSAFSIVASNQGDSSATDSVTNSRIREIIGTANTLLFSALTAEEQSALSSYLADNPSALLDQNFQNFAPGSVLAWALGMGTGLELSNAAISLGFAKYNPGQNLFTKEAPKKLLPLIVATQTGVVSLDAGSQYSLTLQAYGGTGSYTWTAQGLPPGLSLSGNVISGTVNQPADNQAHNYAVTITAKDGIITASQNFTIQVNPKPTPPPGQSSAPVITGVQGYDAATKQYTNVTAAPGKYLIVYGNFSDNKDNQAQIDGQSANVTGQTQNQINILLDSGLSAGRHTVSVQNPGGSSNQQSFSVVASSNNMLATSTVYGLTFDKASVAFGPSGNAPYTAVFLGDSLTGDTAFDVKGTDTSGQPFEILNWQTGPSQLHNFSSMLTKLGKFTITDARIHTADNSADYVKLDTPAVIELKAGDPGKATSFSQGGPALSILARGPSSGGLTLAGAQTSQGASGLVMQYGGNVLSNPTMFQDTGGNLIAVSAATAKGQAVILNYPLITSGTLLDSSGNSYVINYFAASKTYGTIKAAVAYGGKAVVVTIQDGAVTAVEAFGDNGSSASFGDLPQNLQDQILKYAPAASGQYGFLVAQQNISELYMAPDGSYIAQIGLSTFFNCTVTTDQNGNLLFVKGTGIGNMAVKAQRGGNSWALYKEGYGWDKNNNWAYIKVAMVYDFRGNVVASIANPQISYAGDGQITSLSGTDDSGKALSFNMAGQDLAAASGPYTFIPLNTSTSSDTWEVLQNGQVVASVNDSGKQAYEFANENNISNFEVMSLSGGLAMGMNMDVSGVTQYHVFNPQGKISTDDMVLLNDSSSGQVTSTQIEQINDILQAVLTKRESMMYVPSINAFIFGKGGAVDFINALVNMAGADPVFSDRISGVYIPLTTLKNYVKNINEEGLDHVGSLYKMYLQTMVDAGYLDQTAYNQGTLQLTNKANLGILIGDAGSAEMSEILYHESLHRDFWTDKSFHDAVVQAFKNQTPYQQLMGQALLQLFGNSTYNAFSIDPSQSGFQSLITELYSYSHAENIMDVTKFNATNFKDFESAMEYVTNSLRQYLQQQGVKDVSGVNVNVVGNSALIQVGTHMYYLAMQNGKINFNVNSGSFEAYQVEAPPNKDGLSVLYDSDGTLAKGTRLDYFQNGVGFQLLKDDEGQWQWNLVVIPQTDISITSDIQLVKNNGKTLGIIGHDEEDNLVFIAQNGNTNVTFEKNTVNGTEVNIASLKNSAGVLIMKWQVTSEKQDAQGNVISTTGKILGADGEPNGDTVTVPSGNLTGTLEVSRNNSTGEITTIVKDKNNQPVFRIDDSGVHIANDQLASLGWLADASKSGPGQNDPWNPHIPQMGLSQFEQEWVNNGGNSRDLLYGGGF